MNSKKKIHPVIKLLLVFFVIYIALFIANASGYYEHKIRNRTYATSESIKAFEESIDNNEEIDLSSFMKKEDNDYRNKISNLGENMTTTVEGIVSGSMSFFTDIFKHLF